MLMQWRGKTTLVESKHPIYIDHHRSIALKAKQLEIQTNRSSHSGVHQTDTNNDLHTKPTTKLPPITTNKRVRLAASWPPMMWPAVSTRHRRAKTLCSQTYIFEIARRWIAAQFPVDKPPLEPPKSKSCRACQPWRQGWPWQWHFVQQFYNQTDNHVCQSSGVLHKRGCHTCSWTQSTPPAYGSTHTF